MFSLLKNKKRNMKKTVLITGLAFALISGGGVAGAAKNQNHGNKIVDLSPVEQKSTQSQSLDNSLNAMSGGSYTVNSSIDGSFSTWRADSEALHATAVSDVTRAIDYVYAKARVFENGGVVGSASDTSKGSSYAGATAKGPAGFVTWDNDARGNHTYKDSGYKDIIHETYTSSW
jgi:hypothetical protein